MRAEEWISATAVRSKTEEGLRLLKKGIPLGVDDRGETVFSQRREHTFTARHTCVTGANRTDFIKRLVITLSQLYQGAEACFLVASPRASYGELMKLKTVDVTVPFVRSKADIEDVKKCVCEIIEKQTVGQGCAKLVLILDGLEEIADCNENGDLEEYRTFLELLARRESVDVITGVELMQSIFSGYPGAFVGVGNCLVTTKSDGSADVTYVDDDSSLSLPTAMAYPNAPSVAETVLFLNALPKAGGGFGV